MTFIPGSSDIGPEDVRRTPTDDQLARMTLQVDATRAASEVAQAERDRQDAARRAADDERRLAALTDELRALYLEVPGQTEAGFQRALPQLLEDVARRTVNDRLSGNYGHRPASSLTRSEIINQ